MASNVMADSPKSFDFSQNFRSFDGRFRRDTLTFSFLSPQIFIKIHIQKILSQELKRYHRDKAVFVGCVFQK